jgi:phosphoglycolate phosphatase-like HAD superfamily hydrolase
MLNITGYDLYIFDCDGVLLDSNQNKIKAMQLALESLPGVTGGISESLAYFTSNFGKSRYHHVEIFKKNYLVTEFEYDVENLLLENYAIEVDKIYADSPIIPSVIDFLKKLTVPCFVASGSEKNQLRTVLKKKGLSGFFSGIYGSPERKVEIIKKIKEENIDKRNIVMIGDAIADQIAAMENEIDFIGISKYSNTPEHLIECCAKYQHYCFEDWVHILDL